jgi:hypothetical protein
MSDPGRPRQGPAQRLDIARIPRRRGRPDMRKKRRSIYDRIRRPNIVETDPAKADRLNNGARMNPAEMDWIDGATFWNPLSLFINPSDKKQSI